MQKIFEKTFLLRPVWSEAMRIVGEEGGRNTKYTNTQMLLWHLSRAGELAGFEVVGGKEAQISQTVIVGAACTHPECSHCIEMDNAPFAHTAQCKMHPLHNNAPIAQ